MKFLIPTEPDDTHAILAKLALEDRGHDVRFLFLADQPTKLKNSVFMDNDTYQWRSTNKYESIVDNDYDVVWWRRARKPYLPKDIVDPDDYKFIVNENMMFYESLTNNLAPKAKWINPKSSAFIANSKLLQLRMAADCDLKIPTTLCSNDPQDIRHFLLKHEKSGVIYKSLTPSFWFEEKQIRINYTSKVSFLELPPNKLLQFAPGIFQKEIKKKYELRITFFGDYLVATKLNSQTHIDGKLDWRAIPEGEMNIEPYMLPGSLETKIRNFMKKMGLVFGSLDFIVDENHDYIFLEVNEQGQFLWIEEYNPDIKMLDIFIQFLLNKSNQFRWANRGRAQTIDDYRKNMECIMAKNMQRHIDLNNEKIYNS